VIDKLTFYRECAEKGTKCSQCKQYGTWQYTHTLDGVLYYVCKVCGNTAIYEVVSNEKE